MRKGPEKITLAQAVSQGGTIAELRCVTPLPPDVRRPGSIRSCFHARDIPIADLLARYPETTRLNEIRGRCSVCGGRDIDVTVRAIGGYGIGG